MLLGKTNEVQNVHYLQKLANLCSSQTAWMPVFLAIRCTVHRKPIVSTRSIHCRDSVPKTVSNFEGTKGRRHYG